MPNLQTVQVRPLTFDDVEAIKSGETVRAYRARETYAYGSVVEPVTLHLLDAPRRTDGDGEPVFPSVVEAVPDPRPRAQSAYRPGKEVVGHRVRVRCAADDGMETEVTLYDTAEAEQAIDLQGGHFHPAEEGRQVLAVAADGGAEFPLMPVYGAEATIGLIVADQTPEEVAARVEAVLRAEFGESVIVDKVLTRVVSDLRFNVQSRSGEVLAANVLRPQTRRFMGRGGTSVSEVAPGTVIGR